jgi:segregation and condensation protein A
MAEKTIPWWRRALQFALGGIRSGFGLFQRGGKPGEMEESEPARVVEAREADKANLSEGNETPATGQDPAARQAEAIESPLESEGKDEEEELAEEIPLPAAVTRVNEEAASNLQESAPAGEKGEPQHENEAHEAAPDSEPVAELKEEAERTVDLHLPEPVIEAEKSVPVQMDVLEGRVEEAEILEADAEVEAETGTAEPAQVMGEVEAERIEATAAAVTNEVSEFAMDEPTNDESDEKWSEELETVEAESTVVVTGADLPTEEDVKGVKGLEVPAEEPVAAAASAAAAEVEGEEPAKREAIELQPAVVEEPVTSEAVSEENTGSQGELVDEPVSAESQLEEDTPIGDGDEAQASKLHEESSDEPVVMESEVVEEAGSEELIEIQIAETAEEPFAEEKSAEAQPEEQAAAEPAIEKEISHAAVLEVEEVTRPAAPEVAAAIGGSEAESEAGMEALTAGREAAVEAGPESSSTPAAPAQLELIPKPQVDEKAAAKLAEQLRRRKEAETESPFSVMVGQVYDGPLDLLLDLIRKQDIDIYDIPIAKITAQFLAYVNQLKASDVDVAGEFIYTASLLIHIKSKMLLPRTVEGPGEAPEDPRRELVERLLEHERFKNAAQMLQQKQMMEAASWSNPGYREFVDDEGAEPEIAADTVDLVKVFREILERARNRPVLDVAEDTVTVGQMIQFLGRRLMMEDKPIALRKLLSHTRSERALIAMFLALLELVRLQAVLLRQDRQFSEIFIKKHAAFDTVMNEGLANARDDWR